MQLSGPRRRGAARLDRARDQALALPTGENALPSSLAPRRRGAGRTGGRMIAGRLFGYLAVAVALGVAGWDIVGGIAGGAWQVTALGSLWYELDRTSLNLVQAVTQRYIHPALWDPVAITLLQWPAAVVFAALGIVLLLLFRKRRRRRSRLAG